MQYTRYMDQCRRRLSQAIELQTDCSIHIMIGMQNVCLDALDTFTLYDFENVEVSGDLAIKSLVHGFMERLRAIEEKAKIQRGGPLLRMCSVYEASSMALTPGSERTPASDIRPIIRPRGRNPQGLLAHTHRRRHIRHLHNPRPTRLGRSRTRQKPSQILHHAPLGGLAQTRHGSRNADALLAHHAQQVRVA